MWIKNFISGVTQRVVSSLIVEAIIRAWDEFRKNHKNDDDGGDIGPLE